MPDFGEDVLPKKIWLCGQLTQIILKKIICATDEVRQQLDADDNVLNGNWNSDRFNMNWYNRDNANDNIRFRQIVFPKKAPEWELSVRG